MGAVVTGGGGALAGRWRGDRRRKSLARGEGARGLAGAAADLRWGVISGQRGGVGPAVGSCFGAARRRWGQRFGRWWLAAQGVQVEDELQALPKLHVKCLSATIAFSFDNNIQIPQ